jgi:uncharacterized protein (TIGR03086 family)
MVRDVERRGVAEPTLELLALADAELQRRLQLVEPNDWTRQTPCTEWDVRALVNHVIGGNVRYEMLLHGAPAVEVDATRARDHLGDDPVAAFAATGAVMRAAFAEPGALDRLAHHPIGDRTGRELFAMRILDLTVHGWDLAQALGVDDELDAGLVAYALTEAPAMVTAPGQRSFASPIAGDGDRSPQEQLLRLLGRQPRTREAT